MSGSCHCRMQKRELSPGVLLWDNARQRAARGRPGRSPGAALPPRPQAAARGPVLRTGEHLAPQSASAPSQLRPQPQRVDSLSSLLPSGVRCMKTWSPDVTCPVSLPGLLISLPVLNHPSGRQPFL